MPEFTIEELASKPALGIRKRVRMEEVPAFMGEAFGRLYAHAQAHGLTPAGMPASVYHDMPTDTIDVEAVMPLSGPAEGAGDIAVTATPGGRTVTVVHVGPYEGLPGTYRALWTWVGEQGLSPAGPPWEEYFTDPNAEPDPAKWVTHVHQPVA
jgi:effector-binding domain-containing protein